MFKPSNKRPGFFKPGTFKPNGIRPGTRKPGKLRPGFNKPNIFKPGRLKPGTFKPGTFKPGILKPGTLKPGTFKPGTLKPGVLKPGIKIGKNGIPLKPLGIGPAAPGLGKVNFADRFKGGKLGALTNTTIGNKLNLQKQFDLKLKGDVARQLGLANKLMKNGGWHNNHHHGLISNLFHDHHFGHWYPGHGCFPSYCWYPTWSSWVDWCWWDYCSPVYDPRPIYCRPVVCEPCYDWVYWECPVWEPLPTVVCGTWIDVSPVVIDSGLDLQMLAVRMVDPGHPEQDLGPRYRVWFRNNSPVNIAEPFNVMLFASNEAELSAGLPEAGMRVTAMEAGQTQSVDIRLPVEANRMGKDAEGRQVPFSNLHVLIDSQQEVPEGFEKNNGAMMASADVLPVDPSSFSGDSETAPVGSLFSIAGEGFGPEPGQVVVYVNGLELQAEIQGWYDLGVRVKLPQLPLAGPAQTEVVVVRGDGAAANPLSVTLTPTSTAALPIATP